MELATAKYITDLTVVLTTGSKDWITIRNDGQTHVRGSTLWRMSRQEYSLKGTEQFFHVI